MKTTSRNVQLFGGGLVEPARRRQNRVLFYDADCSLCAGTAFHLRPFLLRHRVRLVPIQTPWVLELLAQRRLDPFLEMRLLNADGSLHGGADAILELARTIWWARPLAACARGLHLQPILRRLYAQLAKRRHCVHGLCKLHHVHT